MRIRKMFRLKNKIFPLILIAALIPANVHAANAPTAAEQMEDIYEHLAVSAMSEVWNIKNGGLTEDASADLLTEAVEAYEKLPEDNEHRTNLEVIAEAAEAELAKPILTFYGNCTITHYCNCSECCGIWAGCNTASGLPPVEGRTVAHNYLPFGTRVLIEGHEYIVDDRGDVNMDGGDWFDIYVNDHRTANVRGMHRTDVYIVTERENG